MMKRNLRIVTLCLLLALLLPAVVGCKTEPKQTETTAEETEAEVDLNIPAQVDMNGFEFTVLCRETDFLLKEVWVEEGADDPISQELFERNSFVEEYYNCYITAETVAESTSDTVFNNRFRTAVLSNRPDIHMALGHMLNSATESVNATTMNWNEVPNIELSGAWWHQSIIEELDLNGRLYLAASDYCISSVDLTWVMIFNMEMAQTRGYDVYGMVENGTWTLDNFITMVRESNVDNGNGQVDVDLDTFGFVTHNDTAVTNWMFALDIPIMRLNDENQPEFLFSEDRMLKSTDKIYELLFESGTLYFDPANLEKFGGLSHTVAIPTKFASETALFAALRILSLDTLRDSDVQYGIIPYPKYDEAQEHYYSHVDGRSSLMFLPANLTGEELENTGLLAETLSYLSWRDVMPEIQDDVLLGRYSQDSQAYRMLTMTMEYRTYAFAYVYSFASSSNPYWLLTNLLKEGKKDVVSTWKNSERIAKRDFSDVLELYFPEE